MTATEPDFASMDVEASFDPPADDTPKRTRKPRSDKGQPRGGSGSTGTRTTSTKKLEQQLLEPWAELATNLAITAPTVSAVLIEDGEKTVSALVRIAQRHPKMLAAMKSASKVADVVAVGQTGLKMIVAGGMDMGRIPPGHPLSRIGNVHKLYEEVHPHEQGFAVPDGFVPEQGTGPPPFPMNGTAPGGARFAPPGWVQQPQ